MNTLEFYRRVRDLNPQYSGRNEADTSDAAVSARRKLALRPDFYPLLDATGKILAGWKKQHPSAAGIRIGTESAVRVPNPAELSAMFYGRPARFCGGIVEAMLESTILALRVAVRRSAELGAISDAADMRIGDEGMTFSEWLLRELIPGYNSIAALTYVALAHQKRPAPRRTARIVRNSAFHPLQLASLSSGGFGFMKSKLNLAAHDAAEWMKSHRLNRAMNWVGMMMKPELFRLEGAGTEECLEFRPELLPDWLDEANLIVPSWSPFRIACPALKVMVGDVNLVTFTAEWGARITEKRWADLILE